MKRITSPNNPRLKAAIRLKTSRGRKIQQRIIIFGFREVCRAIESGIKPLEIFTSSEILTAEQASWIGSNCAAPTSVYDLPADLFQKLRYGERIDGVVAIAQRPDLSIGRITIGDKALVVILESIEKPGNIGAALRSCDAVGVDAVILADPQCDVLHPNCVRASLGSVFTIPLAIVSSRQALQWCDQNKLKLLVTSDSATANYWEEDLTQAVAIAFGNEATGLTDQWLNAKHFQIGIPMNGISDSLNISVAAGVVLYEAHRQRQT